MCWCKQYRRENQQYRPTHNSTKQKDYRWNYRKGQCSENIVSLPEDKPYSTIKEN